MSEPLAHLYPLALRTLDIQERRVTELRGRLAPVLAAGGAGATLLSGPAIAAASAGPPASYAALLLAAVGLAVTLGGSARLLTARVERRGIDVLAIRRSLRGRGALADSDAYYTLMLPALHVRAAAVDTAADKLERVFTRILCGILVMLCGLALVALVA
ncbi:hypothetical protein [Conexibacter woesei]|uniref:Uncharacterized protein n=1 Tax=Conexibacter woesei (strain DSM 14684 / CCUG 47730 / CIP 108061 / JCM 11494 / NBRC 100937 / ID131577) TaxID=469383 RepID=D3F5T5_CONWI|nr:hypothetical protein [Conexibacter woesei]ADB52634.1 hypothetical protein Cwoe_4220 [Conexibacter woesei DSM 14684]